MNDFQTSIQELLASIKFEDGQFLLKGEIINVEESKSKDMVVRLQKTIYAFYTRKRELEFLENEKEEWNNNLWKTTFGASFTQHISFWKTSYAQQENNFSPSGVCQVENGINRILENPIRYIVRGQESITERYIVEVAQENVLFNNKKEIDDPTPFIWIFGKYILPRQSSLSTLVRFYFNLIPNQEKVKLFIQDLQFLFDTYEIPFSFKFIESFDNSSDNYGRADSAVLYVSQKHFYTGLFLIQQLHQKHYSQSVFFDDVPHFTYPVFEGIGFAENPEIDEEISFGTFRSRKIARIIYYLMRRNKKMKMPNFKAIMKAIEADYYFDRIDIKRPYLNHSSTFQYDFSIWSVNKLLQQDFINTDYLPNYLNLSVILARQICKEAIWLFKEDGVPYCTWISIQNNNKVRLNFQTTDITFQPIDSSFDKGSLGIFFFLKLLSAVREISEIDRHYFTKIAESVARKVCYPKPLDTANLYEEVLDLINSSKNNLIIQKPEKRDENFEKMIDAISGEPIDKNYEKKIQEVLKHLFDRKIKISNGIPKSQGFYFCPNLGEGLACIGYFLARFYAPMVFPAIPKNLLLPEQ
jgi:hypothetical protein